MKENKLGKKIAFFLLLAVCIIWLFPLIWAVFTSFVEQEINGLLTYDRQPKCDLNEIKKINDSFRTSHLE